MLFSVAGIYDSWITVGITTGDSTSAMGSIGFQWDQWTATTGLNTTNGAVFWTNPDAGPTSRRRDSHSAAPPFSVW